MGKIGYNDKVITTNAHAYRNCRDVFLNQLESQQLLVADFTDSTGVTGTLDFDVELPANAIVVGFKAEVAAGFAGDTSCVISIGTSGDADQFCGITTASCFAAGTVGGFGNFGVAMATTAQTVRVTVTGASDFGLIASEGNGDMTITLYYFIAS